MSKKFTEKNDELNEVFELINKTILNTYELLYFSSSCLHFNERVF